MAELSSEEKQAVLSFKDKVNVFVNAVDDLKRKKALVAKQPKPIQDKYNDLMRRASAIESTVRKIKAGIDWVAQKYEDVKQWFVDTAKWIGLAEVEKRASNHLRQELGALGLPVIPIAIIGTVIATITKFIIDYRSFNRMLDEQLRLEKQVGPQKAADIVTQVATGQRERTSIMPSFIGIDFKKYIIPAALGIAAIIILPRVFGGQK